MAVRMILCRHSETGAEAEIPETGLQHLPAYIPVDEEDRKRLGYTDQPAGDPPAAADQNPSKPATGAAKKTKEHTSGD